MCNLTKDFTLLGCSVSGIIDHEGGVVRNPRVEFHFIDRYTDEEYLAGVNELTPASPYNFVNNHGEYQTTQILKNGESLELINDPDNVSIEDNGVKTEKFFYGWYLVTATSDNTTRDTAQEPHKYNGSIVFTWPDEDPSQIKFDMPITITKNDVNGDGKITVADEDDTTIDDTITWNLNGATGTGSLDKNGTLHVYLAPLFEDFHFINYHKGPKTDNTGLANNLMLRKLVVFGNRDQAEVRIGNVFCDSPDPTHLLFSGWEDEEDNFYKTVNHVEDASGNLINVEVSSEGRTDDKYYITVDKHPNSVTHLNLYPTFDEARWVYFNRGLSGNGSTYVGAAYRLTNDTRQGATDSYYYFDKEFFTGSENTQSHMSRRAGYKLEGWYILAHMDEPTSKITNLYDPETIEVSYLNDNNVKQNTTINTTAIKLVDGDGTILSRGAYYVSSSGMISQNDSGTKLFEVDGEGKLRFYKALDQMTLYANWVPIDQAEYTVIIWKESMTDTYTGNAVPDKRKFDFDKSYTLVGTVNTIANAVNATGSSVTDAEGTFRNAVITGTTAANATINEELAYTGFHLGKYDVNVTIAPEGTSVINVYYYRNVVTYQFYTYGQGEVGYTITTSDNETPQQYGFVNGEYVPLTHEAKEVFQWTAQETYTPTGSNTDAEEYGLDSGEYVRLTPEGHTQTNTFLSRDGSTEYDGTVYYVNNYRLYDVTWTPQYGDGYTYYWYESNYSYGQLNWVTSTETTYTYTLNDGEYTGPRFLKGGADEYAGTVYTRSGDSMPYTYTAIDKEDADNDPQKYGLDTYGGHVPLTGGNVTQYTWVIPEYGDVYTESTEMVEKMYGEIGGEKVELTPIKETTTTYEYTTTLTAGKEYLLVSTNGAGNGYALGHNGTNVASNPVNVKADGTKRYIDEGVDSTSVWLASSSDNYFRFNNNGYYISYASGGYYGLSIRSNTDYTRWSWSGNNNRLSSEQGPRYLRYSNGWGIQSNTANVYLFQKNTTETITGYNYNGETYEGKRWVKSSEPTGNYIPYTGTRWVQTAMGNGWNLYRDEIGLYGEKLNWPSDTSWWWYEGKNNYGTAGSGTRMTYKDAFLPLTADMTVEYWGAKATGTRQIIFSLQNIEHTEEYDEAERISSGNANFSINDKFSGFHAYQYSVNGGAWQNVGTLNTSTGIYGSAVSFSNSLEIRYNRNINDLIFFANYPTGQNLTYNGVAEDAADVVKSPDEYRVPDLMYGADISGYSNYYTIAENNPTGPVALIAPDYYEFKGWFKDDACTVPFDFTETMPDGNAIAYASWSPIRYNVRINPDGGEIDHVNHGGYDSFGSRTVTIGDNEYTYNFYNLDTEYSQYPLEGAGIYNETFQTYIRASHGTTLTIYDPVRRFVAMNETAAAQYEANGGTVYYYVNYQLSGKDGASGIHNDVRSALYLTEDELRDFYQLYRNIVIYSLGRYASSNVGMELQDYDTWCYNYVANEKRYVNGQLVLTKYRPLTENEHWTFLGWYKDNETMPYTATDPVTAPFTLTAKWRLDGGYKIKYVPKYTMPGGKVVNGTMSAWVDPVDDGFSYSDGANTEIYKAPTGLTIKEGEGEEQAIKDDSVIFRGWALVLPREYDDDGNPIKFRPVEVDSSDAITTYYLPSDPYVVNAVNASTDGNIYLQAIYQYQSASDRRPKVANLILDANTGYINAGYAGIAPSLPAWTYYPGKSVVEDENNLVTVNGSTVPGQILFGDIQAEAAVHLYKYATELTKDAAGNTLTDANQFFTHPRGFFLLGFDDSPTEGDYRATYAADSVITVQRTDEKTIYAVWEPMVYVTFKNETRKGAVTFNLSAKDNQALQVINIRDGLYDRVPLESLENITLADGESISLAFPYGAERELTVNGTNNLGIGNMLVWNTKLELKEGGNPVPYDTAAAVSSYTHTYEGATHSHALASGSVNNTKPFTFDETMIVNEEPMVVTFTSISNDYALILDDNYEGGGTQEFDYSSADIERKSQKLPTTSTRIGYEFQGWADQKTATEPDFSADKPTDNPWTIANLSATNGFFSMGTTDEDGTIVRRLYAVWKSRADAQTVYVYKDVPTPGDQTKDFDFTVAISGRYHVGSTPVDVSASHDFQLKHGWYLKLFSSNDNGTQNSTAYIQTEVTVYNAEGVQQGDPVTVRWDRSVSPSSSNGFNEMHVTVTEGDAQYYDTSVIRNAHTSPANPIYLGNSSDVTTSALEVETNTAYWNHTDAGGTLVFKNQRQTYDVDVYKTLVSNTSAARPFSFTYSYTDGGKDVSVPVNVLSGGHETLTGIPAGVELTITEDDEAVNNYVTTVKLDDGEPENGAEKQFTVDKKHTVTFHNTLKSYPVKFMLVDQNLETNVNGQFNLASEATHGNLGTELYANKEGTSEYGPGVFYTSDKFWVDTYTLSQISTSPGYFKLDGDVILTVTGDGIESSDKDNVKIEPDGDGGYIIKVINRKKQTITVKKVLDDPVLQNGTRTFGFEYSYTPEGEENAVTGEFMLEVDTVNGRGEASRTIEVPLNAKVTVTEKTTGENYSDIAKIYGIVMGSDVFSDDDDKDAYAFTIATADKDGTVTFTNTRKTANVTVRKVITGTSEDRAKKFSMTAEAGGVAPNSFVLALNDKEMMELYVGTKLTVTETFAVGDENKYNTTSVVMTEDITTDLKDNGNGFTMTVPEKDCMVLIHNDRKITQLTIQKTVDGAMGDTSAGNKFTFSLDQVGSEGENIEYVTTRIVNNESEGGTIKRGQTFELAHGEAITLSLPQDVAIRITENNRDYTTSWQLDEGVKQNGNVITIGSLTGEKTTLSVVNSHEAVSPTGVDLRVAPYALMLLMGLALMMGLRYGKKRQMN